MVKFITQRRKVTKNAEINIRILRFFSASSASFVPLREIFSKNVYTQSILGGKYEKT